VQARGRALTTAGALLVGAGAATWATGSILELGGHRAVGLMATHTNPIQTTNSIAFTIDTVVAAFAFAAFAFIGLGMLAVAAVAAREHSGHRTWAGYTVVIALTLLVLAWSYATANSDLSDLLLFAVGVAPLPLWLIWTCRIGRSVRECPTAPWGMSKQSGSQR
jgi:hypothetical protein